MAIIQASFNAPSIFREAPVTVILPTDKYPLVKKPFRTIYLLHGYTGNYLDWLARTRVMVWAQDNDLCVVMPSGENMFYVNNTKTNQMWSDFITRDLITFTRASFPLSDKREDTYISGLSMGGYGSIVNGLANPDVFGGIAAFSSCLDIGLRKATSEYTSNPLTNKGFIDMIFDAPDLAGTEYDPVHLASSVASVKPRVYMSCGTEDSFIDCNRDFRDTLKGLGYDITWFEGKGGHEWDFWNAEIEKAINWMVGE